ncbi:MFS transporter [Methylobacterium sp. C25]|uniref:MFS transporter n=1 Tax=Methylobacterium sp. C25 TaxID=2721622 RepID=UPI001F1CA6F4|nr:MFS transporter [Methylobacterium sp. C25]MCE4226233.1 MFS transporter [Methylobacterium sp. C25]
MNRPISQSPSKLIGEPVSTKAQVGYRAIQWRMLLIVMFCYLFYYTGRQTLGFAIPGIQAEFNVSKQLIGWVSAGMLWGYAIGQAINGNLGDKYGGRRIVTAGAISSSLMNWVVSFSVGYKSLLVSWWLNGYLQALGFAPGSRIISNWWTKAERGKVYGLYLFAAGMSSVVTYVLGLLVVDTFHLEWRWVFRLPVVLLMVAGIVFYFVVRDNPEDMGFKREVDADAEKECAADASDAEPESSRERYKAILSNLKIHIGGVALGFNNAARYGLVVWVPVHFLEATAKLGEVTGLNARWITVALPVGMAFGALSNGWISDRFFGSVRWKPIALYMLLAVGATAVMYTLPISSIWAIVVLFLCGFFVYGPHATFWALVPDLVGRQRAGTATGVMSTYSYLFAGLAEPAIGHLLDIGHNTALVFIVVGTCCALSGTCAVLIKR